MSMILILERIASATNDGDIERGDESESIEEVRPLRIFNDEKFSAETDRQQQESPASFASCNNDELEDSEQEGETLSLEKAWHGLHYLLTGESWGGSGPRAFLLHGGKEHGEDFGYGPARYLSSNEVLDIAKELGRLTVNDLWASFDPHNMNAESIYPGIWEESEEELREEYGDYFAELQAFVADTADKGEALRIFLS